MGGAGAGGGAGDTKDVWWKVSLGGSHDCLTHNNLFMSCKVEDKFVRDLWLMCAVLQESAFTYQLEYK